MQPTKKEETTITPRTAGDDLSADMGGKVDRAWLDAYFDRYRRSLLEADVADELLRVRDLFLECQKRGNKVIIAGNGGSAGIADHCALDLTKNAGIRTVSFAGAGWITCLANDYGYADWVSRSLELYGDRGDVAVLISSSGRSENMLKAACVAKARGMSLVTLSGLAPDNALRSAGDINLWVDSRAYNIVEMTHQIWLLAVCDAIIGRAEYAVS